MHRPVVAGKLKRPPLQVDEKEPTLYNQVIGGQADLVCPFLSYPKRSLPMFSKMKVWGLLAVAAMLTLSALACTISTSGGGGGQPFVGGDCEGNTTRLNVNASANGNITGGTSFEQVYQMFCLWVPDNGSRLTIQISGFSSSVDLDLYVDREYSTLLSESGFGEWYSNGVNTTSEEVTINNPGGRYYIQVVSYDGSPSSFTISNTFTP
jgi:hypothetical protein